MTKTAKVAREVHSVMFLLLGSRVYDHTLCSMQPWLVD